MVPEGNDSHPLELEDRKSFGDNDNDISGDSTLWLSNIAMV